MEVWIVFGHQGAGEPREALAAFSRLADARVWAAHYAGSRAALGFYGLDIESIPLDPLPGHE
jgi:hypothetical protein